MGTPPVRCDNTIIAQFGGKFKRKIPVRQDVKTEAMPFSFPFDLLGVPVIKCIVSAQNDDALPRIIRMSSSDVSNLRQNSCTRLKSSYVSPVMQIIPLTHLL